MGLPTRSTALLDIAWSTLALIRNERVVGDHYLGALWTMVATCHAWVNITRARKHVMARKR